MRKITSQIITAFMKRRALKLDNSRTDGNSLCLYGNRIACHDESNIVITNAGWFSNTTKERLNGLPGISIYQKKGVWHLNGEIWDGKPIAVREKP